MKLNRLYFSPTGGTEKVVKLLSDAWDCEKCDLDFSVCDGDYACTFGREELCIIGVPSFGGRVPAVALEHLRRMKADGTPAILVAAYGNRDYDDTLLELKETVKQIGFRVIAAVAAVTEHSVMRQFGAGRPDDADRAELLSFGQRIRASGASLSEVAVKGNTPYKVYSGIPLKPAANKACNQCGACATVCPVGAIPPKTPSQTRKEACISCMRCISICPQHARKLNRVLLFVAAKGLKAKCTGRKQNELFVGESQ